MGRGSKQGTILGQQGEFEEREGFGAVMEAHPTII